MPTHKNRYEHFLNEFCSSESWKVEHNDAMRVRDLEDNIAMGVKVFEYLQGREVRAYERTPEGQLADEAQLADIDSQFARLYAQWHATAEAAFNEARRLESKHYEVAGLDELLTAMSQTLPYAEAQRRDHAFGEISSTKLNRLAETHQPPESWHEGEDC